MEPQLPRCPDPTGVNALGLPSQARPHSAKGMEGGGWRRSHQPQVHLRHLLCHNELDLSKVPPLGAGHCICLSGRRVQHREGPSASGGDSQRPGPQPAYPTAGPPRLRSPRASSSRCTLLVPSPTSLSPTLGWGPFEVFLPWALSLNPRIFLKALFECHCPGRVCGSFY